MITVARERRADPVRISGARLLLCVTTLGAIAVTAAATATGAAPAAAANPAIPPALQVVQSRVTPAHAFFGGRSVQVAFRFAAGGPLDLELQIVRQASGHVARRFALPQAAAQQPQSVSWDGLTDRGRVAPDGRYRVRLLAPGGLARWLGALTLHGNVFPVHGRHGVRGPIGKFGVPRSGGRTHQGFDVTAACGTPLVAARAGRVRRRAYDPLLYGNYVIIRGRLTDRDYWYAHLRNPAQVRAGQQVDTGQRIGRVGDTGNARGTGCHLHFELRVRGRPIDPERQLKAWDGWS